MITVSQLGQVFVKATRFLHPEFVEIDRTGIRHDRDFALAEADGTFVSTERHGDFFQLKFLYQAAEDWLTLELPDGRVIQGSAAGGGTIWQRDHFGIRTFLVREVLGPWAPALSDLAGRSIRLVRCVDVGAAIDLLPITLVTTGSLRRLSRELGAPQEAARFRCGLVVANELEHEEDGWANHLLRVGAVVLKVRTPVPRCAIPSFNPESGARDLDVMKGLIRYRDNQAYPDGVLAGVAKPAFASYAEVMKPGRVHVGDSVELLT